MALKDLFVQGGHLVVREKSGGIARNEDGTQKRALAPPRGERATGQKESWRRSLSRLTDDGRDLQRGILSIARGDVHVANTVIVDPETGEKTTYRGEPQVPNPSTRLAALQSLHEMLHGKAVAETELVKAEAEAGKMRALAAMSEEDLLSYVEGEVLKKTE